MEFPEWGHLRVNQDSSRFSMSYSMLAIMVSLFGIVIAAVVTVGVAGTIGVVSVLKSQSRVETQMEMVLHNQSSQEQKIDGLKAYAQVQTREADMVVNMLTPAQQAKVERWRRENPRPDLSKVGNQTPQN